MNYELTPEEWEHYLKIRAENKKLVKERDNAVKRAAEFEPKIREFRRDVVRLEDQVTLRNQMIKGYEYEINDLKEQIQGWTDYG